MFMFVLGAIVALFVTVQSIVFLKKAWEEGKRKGLPPERMRKAVVSSAVFTLVPSLSILLTMLTLSGALGLALPWIRLSVIGAVTYELPTTEAAEQAAGASLMGAANTDGCRFSPDADSTSRDSYSSQRTISYCCSQVHV